MESNAKKGEIFLIFRYQERFNHFDENAHWTLEEENLMFSLHDQIGNKWAIISKNMCGRYSFL